MAGTSPVIEDFPGVPECGVLLEDADFLVGLLGEEADEQNTTKRLRTSSFGDGGPLSSPSGGNQPFFFPAEDMDVLAGLGVVAEDAEKAAANGLRVPSQESQTDRTDLSDPVVQGIPQNAPLSDAHGGASLSQFTLPTTAPVHQLKTQRSRKPSIQRAKGYVQKEPKPSPRTSGEKVFKWPLGRPRLPPSDATKAPHRRP